MTAYLIADIDIHDEKGYEEYRRRVPAIIASYGGRYPNTETYSRDRIESQGYRVERITPQNNGSWKAETTRDAVPTRPQGVPSRVTIFPDGRVLEEREPLSVNPPRP